MVFAHPRNLGRAGRILRAEEDVLVMSAPWGKRGSALGTGNGAF